MNIAIIDDDKIEHIKLKGIMSDYASERTREIKFDAYTSGKELLENYRPFSYTAIFLDIYMPEMTGLEVAREIRKSDADVPIIFFTSSTEHTFDAFDIHAYSYVVKTPDYDSLKLQIFKILDDIASVKEDEYKCLEITLSGGDACIPFPNIVFVQSNKNYVMVTDTEGNTYQSRITFSKVAKKLSNDNRFLQINRGIMINMDYIESFDADTCVLSANESYTLPLSVRERKNLDTIQKNYRMNKHS